MGKPTGRPKKYTDASRVRVIEGPTPRLYRGARRDVYEFLLGRKNQSARLATIERHVEGNAALAVSYLHLRGLLEVRK
jgi:hypothetical protein